MADQVESEKSSRTEAPQADVRAFEDVYTAPAPPETDSESGSAESKTDSTSGIGKPATQLQELFERNRSTALSTQELDARLGKGLDTHESRVKDPERGLIDTEITADGKSTFKYDPTKRRDQLSEFQRESVDGGLQTLQRYDGREDGLLETKSTLKPGIADRTHRFEPGSRADGKLTGREVQTANGNVLELNSFDPKRSENGLVQETVAREPGITTSFRAFQGHPQGITSEQFVEDKHGRRTVSEFQDGRRTEAFASSDGKRTELKTYDDTGRLISDGAPIKPLHERLEDRTKLPVDKAAGEASGRPLLDTSKLGLRSVSDLPAESSSVGTDERGEFRADYLSADGSVLQKKYDGGTVITEFSKPQKELNDATVVLQEFGQPPKLMNADGQQVGVALGSLPVARLSESGVQSVKLSDGSTQPSPQIKGAGGIATVEQSEGDSQVRFAGAGERKSDVARESAFAQPDKGHGSDVERLTKLFKELDKAPTSRTFQDLGDTLSTLNSKQIDRLKKDLPDGKGGTLLDSLKDNPKIPEAQRKALEVYLKGTDKRTASDTVTLAKNAIDARDLPLLWQGLRQSTPEGRSLLARELKPNALEEAFGKRFPTADGNVDYATTRELRFARDLVERGSPSFQTLLRDQEGIISTPEEAIRATINQLPPERRQAIADGEKIFYSLSGDGEKQSDSTRGDISKLTPEQRKSLEEYTEARAALTRATNPTEALKWLDHIDNGGTRLVGDLAKHRGTFTNSGDEQIQADLQKIGPQDWQRAKSDPVYKQRVSDLLSTIQKGQGLDDSKAILNLKTGEGVKSFDQSKSASDLPLFQLKQEGKLPGFNELKVLGIVEGVDKATLDRLRRDPEYRAKLQDTTLGALKSGAATEAAKRLFSQAAEGQKPELTLTERLSVAGEARTLPDEPTRVRDLLKGIDEAIKKDPGLKERILNPKPEDAKLQVALRAAFPTIRSQGPGSIDRPQLTQPENGQIDLFKAYVKPFVENGRLSLRQEASLGTFDRTAFTEKIASAPEAERREFLDNPGLRTRLTGYWSENEQAIATRTAQNGFTDAPDKLYLAITSKDKGRVEEAYQSVGKVLEPLLKKSFEQRFGSLDKSLEGNFKGAQQLELKTLTKDLPHDQRLVFNQTRDDYYGSKDGWFAKLVDRFSSSGPLAENAFNQYAGRHGDANKRFEQLSPEEQKRLVGNVKEGIRQFVESKDATADVLVDTAITLATATGTGGTSALLRGVLLAAAARPLGKQQLLGDDYKGNVGTDIALGATIGAFNKLGPAQAQKLFGLGDRVAVDTGKALAGQNLISPDKTGAFGSGLQTLIRESFEAGGKVDPEKLLQLSKTFATPGSEKALAQAIETQLSRSSQDVLRDFFKKEIVPGSLAAGTGGGATSFVESELDGRPTSESLSQAFTSFFVNATAGGLGTGLFRGRALANELRNPTGGPDQVVESIFKRTTGAPTEADRQFKEFLKAHKLDVKEPRNAVPAHELFEPPVASKVDGRVIPHEIRKAQDLPHNATESREAVTYKVKGRDLEFVIDKDYAKQLDEVRNLRLAAAEVGSQDPTRAKAAREATELLDKHPHKEAVLPEQVLQILGELPHGADIQRVDLYGFKDPVKATAFRDPRVAEGDPRARDGKIGTLELYTDVSQHNFRNRIKAGDEPLRDVIFHENSHLLEQRYPDELKAYKSAIGAGEKPGSFFSADRAARAGHDPSEDWAVNFGEYFTSPDAGRFALVAHGSPERAIAQTALLQRAIDDLPAAERGKFHTQFQARADYVQHNIVPEYRKVIDAHIASGDIQKLTKHVEFLEQLRQTKHGKSMADAILTGPEGSTILKSGVERALKEGNPDLVKSGVLQKLIGEDPSQAHSLLDRVGKDARFATEREDWNTLRDLFTAQKTPASSKSLLEAAALRGEFEPFLIREALSSLPENVQRDFIKDVAESPYLRGQGAEFLSSIGRVDRNLGDTWFDAAKKAGFKPSDLTSEDVLDGLTLISRSSTNPKLSGEANSLIESGYEQLRHRIQDSITNGTSLDYRDPIALKGSTRPTDRALVVEHSAKQKGGPLDYAEQSTLRLFNQSQGQEFLNAARPFLTEKAYAEYVKYVGALPP